MATNGTEAQLQQIASSLQGIEARVKSGRLFDVLEIIRDQVQDLKAQNQQIRNDVMEVERSYLQQQQQL